MGDSDDDRLLLADDSPPPEPQHILNNQAFWRQMWFIGFCSSFLYGHSYGFVLGYSSPALPSMIAEGVLTKTEGAWFAAATAVGGLTGIPIGGWAVNHIGRQNTMFLCCFPFVIAWIIILSAESSFQLVAGRVFTGMSSGAASIAVPLYISEVAARHLRGKLSALQSVGTTSGILSVYVLGLFLPWRWLAIVSTLPPVLLVMCTYFLPETPRYLLIKHRRGDALNVLGWLHALPINSDIVQLECRNIQTAIDSEKEDISWASFRSPTLVKPLRICMMVMFFHIFCGINVVVFYTQSLFEEAGFKGKAGIPAVILAAVKMMVTCIATSIIDWVGRKKLFATGGVIMSFSCTTFGLYFYLTDNKLVTVDISWLSLGSILIYITAFSLGWNSIPSLIMSELFPAKARGKACTIVGAVGWSSSFLVTVSFFHMQELLGLDGIFWVFGCVCMSGAVYVMLYLPETKDKSLEEIQHFFRNR